MNGILNEDRAVVAAVHPELVEELKFRQAILEQETGRKTRGGLTTFSKLAARELKAMRCSGEQLMFELFKQKNVPVRKFLVNGSELEFVPYECFKKLYIYSSALNKKKDQQQIHVEVAKIKGLKKNEVRMFW